MTVRPLFRLDEVQKRHGSFQLQIRQLEIHRGEILGLLGPTGAGKSTLLRILAGLMRTDHGRLFFDDQTLKPEALSLSARRRLTLVHQHPLLLGGTVRFNVELGLRLRGWQDRLSQVDPLLDRLALSRLAAQSARTLSGGQVQLVALARALAIEPEVLLLDEPTAHLDPAHVAIAEATIREVQQQRGMTVVWATHNLFQARRVACRTALLLNGELVEVGPTGQFYARPSDPRAADFVQGRLIY